MRRIKIKLFACQNYDEMINQVDFMIMFTVLDQMLKSLSFRAIILSANKTKLVFITAKKLSI